MKTIKNQKGITILQLVITIVVMMILIISVTASITSTLELRNYYEVKEDIITLTEEVQKYYVENNSLPVSYKINFPIDTLNADDKNPNDNDIYYKIDIDAMKSFDSTIKLNREEDNYLLNEQSLTVYYENGIELNGQIHYTVVDDFSGGSFASYYYANTDLPIISVVTLESNGEEKNKATSGDTVTLKMLANYSFTTQPTVTICGHEVTVTWNEKVGTATYTLTSEDSKEEGKRLEFSISNYAADGRQGQTITQTTFGEEIGIYVSALEKAKDNNMLSKTENTELKIGDDIVWIPAGYKVAEDSADTVDYGIVITDAETNGNEWVWIPVDRSTLSGMYETASSPIAITGGSSLSVISGVSTSKYSKSGIISGITRGLPNNTSSYREPDVVVGSNGTSYDAVKSNRATAGFTNSSGGTVTLKKMAQTMVDEYSDMIESIKTYGGFYIGRYELSEAGVKKNQPTLVNSTWYTLYAKCKSLAKAGSNVTTRMIWGCQWDVTCNWIANNGEKKSITDSSTWGNYKNTDVYSSDGSTIIKANGSITQLNTGVTTFTRANNIYDLAGNMFEWTQEAYNVNGRAGRGGNYGSIGRGAPVTYLSYNYPYNPASSDGLRYTTYTLFVDLRINL